MRIKGIKIRECELLKKKFKKEESRIIKSKLNRNKKNFYLLKLVKSTHKNSKIKVV